MADVRINSPWLGAVDVAAALDVEVTVSAEFRETGSGPVVVAVDGRPCEYVGEWTWETRLRSLLRYLGPCGDGPQRLLLMPRVPPATATALRDRGIGYLDLTGSAFLKYEGVHIRLNGERRTSLPAWAPAGHIDPVATNLFSPARAQVIFALLQWPRLVSMTVRELAATAGVSTGLVHGTLKGLREEGFYRRTSDEPWLETDRLDRLDELIDVWAAAFPRGLWRRIHVRDYSSDLSSWSVPAGAGADPHVLVGGEMAVTATVVPASVTVYVEGPLDLATRKTHRMAAPADRPANTSVCRKFWTTPDFATDEGSVPWLLTYAELTGRSDPRLREAATELRRHASR